MTGGVATRTGEAGGPALVGLRPTYLADDRDAEDAEPSPIQFREGAKEAGLDFVMTSGDTPDKYFPTANGSGVAIFDYDGDGWLDAYFTTTRELPLSAPSMSSGCRLFRNKGDRTFEDVTERAGVGFKGFTHGVAVGDLDGNGHPDLVLANLGPNVLYLNNGDGTFRDASAGSGLENIPWSSGAAVLDYDRDGRLDLYISCYGQWTQDGEHPFCGDPQRKLRTYCSPQTIPPVRHYLFRNKGGAVFEDVTEVCGVLRSDGRGMGIVTVDVDLDGWIDIYVANDLCPNFLFRNKGDGTFEDLSDLSGAASNEAGINQAGMGVDAEDLDDDGLPELFVTNFNGEYNTLYKNLDGQNFQDVSARSGTVRESLPDVGWGCALADFDNDGLPDILVVNGHVDDNLPEIQGGPPQPERMRVWKGLGDFRFRYERNPGPYLRVPRVGRGAGFGDLDNDGDIDVIACLMDEPAALLWNESPGRGHWVGLRLKGAPGNLDCVGARVEVQQGGRTWHRQVRGGRSYHSANDPRVLVGIGTATEVEAIEITWPRGAHTTLTRDQIRVDAWQDVVEPGEATEGAPGR